jgi:hypothetical protein
MSRIKIPTSPTQLIILGKNIVKKHNEEGDTSVLKFVDMDDFEKKINKADETYSKVLKLRREIELLTEQTHQLLGIHKDMKSSTPGTALYYITQSRDIPKGLFRGSFRKLGNWGFVVDDTAKKKQA